MSHMHVVYFLRQKGNVHLSQSNLFMLLQRQQARETPWRMRKRALVGNSQRKKFHSSSPSVSTFLCFSSHLAAETKVKFTVVGQFFLKIQRSLEQAINLPRLWTLHVSLYPC